MLALQFGKALFQLIADLDRARELSAKKGFAYQTYMKMLLHEALEREERAATQ